MTGLSLRANRAMGALGVAAVLVSPSHAATQAAPGSVAAQQDSPVSSSVGVEAPADERYDRATRQVDRTIGAQEEALPIGAGAPNPVDTTRYRAASVRTRARPEYTAPGLRVGGFQVRPSAKVQLAYDSNVFATSDGDSDFFVKPSANVQVRSDWSRHRLSFDGAISRRIYGQYSSEDGTEYRVAAAARVDVVGASAIEATAVQQRVIVDRSDIGEIPSTRRPLRYNETIGGLDGLIATGRLVTRMGASVTHRDYRDNRLFDGTPLNLDFREFERREAHVDLAYQLHAAQAVFVAVTVDRRRSEIRTRAGSDSNGVEALAGIRGEITPVVRGQIGFGILHYEFLDDDVQNSTGLAINSRLEWLPTEMTTLTFSARRALETSTVRNDLSFIRTSLQLRVDHELLRNVLLLGEISYETADYRSSSRVDRRLIGLVGGDWFINRNLRATLRVSAAQRETSGDLRPDFSDLETTVGVGYAL